ncbi:fibronectin type III domain-containing protein 7-like [Entelurus aequoreus]|uniref:fibronectin type III domain-containing protein 7-like n=1 Tax=Entelurus aequoreus TaxID=161455 RepID=UPI002B1DACEF|nr:fibronectin type III domain-containing protein 7-like [Entelurus aequoreus]
MTNNLTVSWDSDGDVDYFMVWVNEYMGGSSETFNTTSTESSTSNVICGNNYTVQVAAIKGDCQTSTSQTQSVLSAPCQPQGIRGSLDCVTNSAWISWNTALYADCYTVSAVGEDNSVANCTTYTNTTCEVEDLACGILYNFSVTAKNSQCGSQPSTAIDLQTAPCSLSGITAIPQCHNSSILVMWELAEGSEGNTVYTATAEARDHTYLSCNGTGTSCTLYGARCDFRYTVIVAASSDQCSSLRSPPYKISMEPCPPSEVNVTAYCEDHNALVSWSPSPVAATYHVVATAADGHMHACNASSTNCSLTGLHCDEQYQVYVTACHENCSSAASYNVTLNTGPCQPDDVSVTFHCSNQSAVLSWTPSDNAVDYHACAEAWSGQMLHCQSTYPTCTIQNLDCGVLYNFSVQASDGMCNSSFSDPVETGATPCPPDVVEVQHVTMYADVQLLRFNWTDISCADTEYMLALEGNLLGDDQAQFEVSSYWTNRTSFEIPLPCGSWYSATVESRNAAGSSDRSGPLNGTTVPCPPLNVMYSSDSITVVSWDPAVFATMYSVYMPTVSLTSQLCTTPGLSCSLPPGIPSADLLVTASNAAGESEGASVTAVNLLGRRKRDLTNSEGLTAPRIHVTLPKPGVVDTKWSRSDAATDYKLMIKQQQGGSEELTVVGEHIILTNLSPNSTYCLTVSAKNNTNMGPESEPACLQTR